MAIFFKKEGRMEDLGYVKIASEKYPPIYLF